MARPGGPRPGIVDNSEVGWKPAKRTARERAELARGFGFGSVPVGTPKEMKRTRQRMNQMDNPKPLNPNGPLAKWVRGEGG